MRGAYLEKAYASRNSPCRVAATTSGTLEYANPQCWLDFQSSYGYLKGLGPSLVAET
jgi:hypothetical protein